MILSTTNNIEGQEISEYLGLVFGETVNGINMVKDIGAGFRNIVGGRSQGYEDEVVKTRKYCLKELEVRAEAIGADAVVGIKFDFETLASGGMFLLNVSGTAVKLK